MSATREPVPFEPYQAGVYLHGTKADLAVGEMLVPGRESNFEQGRVMNYVYFAATLDAATWGAELAAGPGRGRIYIVEPSGEFEDDPQRHRQKVPREPDAILPHPRAAARGRRTRRLGRSLPGEADGHAERTRGAEPEGRSADRGLSDTESALPSSAPDAKAAVRVGHGLKCIRLRCVLPPVERVDGDASSRFLQRLLGREATGIHGRAVNERRRVNRDEMGRPGPCGWDGPGGKLDPRSAVGAGWKGSDHVHQHYPRPARGRRRGRVRRGSLCGELHGHLRPVVVDAPDWTGDPARRDL